jgi:hypothetical protein
MDTIEFKIDEAVSNSDIVIKENKNNNLKDYDDLGEIEISKYI